MSPRKPTTKPTKKRTYRRKDRSKPTAPLTPEQEAVVKLLRDYSKLFEQMYNELRARGERYYDAGENMGDSEITTMGYVVMNNACAINNLALHFKTNADMITRQGWTGQ